MVAIPRLSVILSVAAPPALAPARTASLPLVTTERTVSSAPESSKKGPQRTAPVAPEYFSATKS